ncbi:coiled-coil-helix-coiled-coil-helix domain containing 3a isoform X8 [Cottoperca gobio]|uniref:Coiled-coil-helix-coiled-coil-helix domain containing 3a isoform X8 n=1 Tax=Cottoperca gobio TaxID=56716 RepID=A0A6J2S2W3_COTGO|nr:MICOS complex subunit MIC19 isoform X8 [Cottoperca gobio]
MGANNSTRRVSFESDENENITVVKGIRPPVEPVSLAPVPEPMVVPELISVPPPPPAAPPVDEEALRKTITDELYKGMEQDRAKAEQELQAWVESEKTRAAAQAQDAAQSQVKDEVSRILSVERAVAQESIQQAVIRERIATEDERLRAQLFEIGRKAKQLGAREADLKKQDAFYREQVARLEERSAQFYKVTTENYHNAADQVNTKFKRYETYPVCADLQGQILACYKENVGKTLNCSNIAALYLQCVNNSKQNVHAPSWTDDITS